MLPQHSAFQICMTLQFSYKITFENDRFSNHGVLGNLLKFSFLAIGYSLQFLDSISFLNFKFKFKCDQPIIESVEQCFSTRVPRNTEDLPLHYWVPWKYLLQYLEHLGSAKLTLMFQKFCDMKKVEKHSSSRETQKLTNDYREIFFSFNWINIDYAIFSIYTRKLFSQATKLLGNIWYNMYCVEKVFVKKFNFSALIYFHRKKEIQYLFLSQA